MKFLADLDARLYSSFSRLEQRLKLYRVARILSFSGDGYAYILITVIAIATTYDTGMALMKSGRFAVGMEMPFYLFLKKFFKRRRPYEVITTSGRVHNPSDEFSFPSGHTTAGFMVAFLVSHFYAWALIPMYIWASLIGLSRVVLRVHFVSDIIAGAALGSLLGVLARRLLSA